MPAQAWTTTIVGVLAVVGVVLTVSQRSRADNRAQSWQRITWCLERTVSEKMDEAALGWKVFGTVATTSFIERADRDTLTTIANHAAESDLAVSDDYGDNKVDTAREDPQ